MINVRSRLCEINQPSCMLMFGKTALCFYLLFLFITLLRSVLAFRGLSVCLSVTFVHYAQTAEDIDTIFYIRQPHVLSIRFKIWLTLIDPCPLKFFPKVSAKCYRMVNTIVTMETIRNHHRYFEWYNR